MHHTLAALIPARWTAAVNPKFEGVSESVLQRTCGALDGGVTLPIKQDDAEVPVGAIPAFFDSRQGAWCLK